MESAVITSVKEVTPELITKLLRRKGVLTEGEVIKVSRQLCNLIATSGFIYRLNLGYSLKTNAPKSVILKLSSKSNQVFSVTTCWVPYKREILFYKYFSPYMPSSTPECYDYAFSEETNRCHLIMEDCHPEMYQLEWEFGPEYKDINSLVDWLASMHAQWWNKVDSNDWLEKLPPLLDVEVVDREMKDLELIMGIFKGRVSNTHRNLFMDIGKKWRLLLELQLDTPKTLCHGDIHVNNLFYSRDTNKTMKVIDWQFCHVGTGVSDLAKFLGLFLHPYTRKDIELSVLKRYTMKLQEYKINYTFEQCLRDYQLEITKNLLMPLVQKNIESLQPSGILQCFRNAILAFEDVVGSLNNEIFRSTFKI